MKEHRKKETTELELRSVGEVRAKGDEGICEGYLTQWDTVDSWNTSFKKGSFSKSIASKGVENIRCIWNHSELAGKVIKLEERDYGPWARVKFNLETRAGQEAYAHVKNGDVNCFSFGFNTVKDKWVGQVRQILEVDIMECGPVIYQANDAAKITGVRSKDFNVTVYERDLSARGYRLVESMMTTLEEIRWDFESESADKVTDSDKAIAEFHSAYVAWMKELYEYQESRSKELPVEYRNAIQAAIRNIDADELVKTTSFTQKEVDVLKAGNILPIESRSKLVEVGGELEVAHKKERQKVIDSLCDEFRTADLTEAEVERFTALLNLSTRSEKVTEMETMASFFEDFRKNI